MEREINLPELGRVRIIKNLPSNNRKVLIVEKEGEYYVVKIFHGQEEWIDKIFSYRQQLENFGILCVPIISLTKFENQIIEIEPALTVRGDLAERLEKSSQEEAIRLIEKLCSGLKPLLSYPQDDLPVGIDVVLRNFAVKDSKIYYLDFFPPKIRLGQEFILEKPEPTDSKVIKAGYYRHYNKSGVALTLLIHLGRARPDLWLYIHQLIAAYSDQKFQNYLVKLSAVKDLKDGIGLFPSERCYLFYRYFACYLASFSPNESRQKLDQIFHLTHFQDKPLSRERLKIVRKELEKWLKEIQ